MWCVGRGFRRDWLQATGFGFFSVAIADGFPGRDVVWQPGGSSESMQVETQPRGEILQQMTADEDVAVVAVSRRATCFRTL